MVAKRGRLAFVTVVLWALDTRDGIQRNGVALAEIVEQRRQRGELAPDGRAGQVAGFEALAPRKDVRACDGAKLIRLRDAGESVSVSPVPS